MKSINFEEKHLARTRTHHVTFQVKLISKQLTRLGRLERIRSARKCRMFQPHYKLTQRTQNTYISRDNSSFLVS